MNYKIVPIYEGFFFNDPELDKMGKFERKSTKHMTTFFYNDEVLKKQPNNFVKFSLTDYGKTMEFIPSGYEANENIGNEGISLIKTFWRDKTLAKPIPSDRIDAKIKNQLMEDYFLQCGDVAIANKYGYDFNKKDAYTSPHITLSWRADSSPARTSELQFNETPSTKRIPLVGKYGVFLKVVDTEKDNDKGKIFVITSPYDFIDLCEKYNNIDLIYEAYKEILDCTKYYTNDTNKQFVSIKTFGDIAEQLVYLKDKTCFAYSEDRFNEILRKINFDTSYEFDERFSDYIQNCYYNSVALSVDNPICQHKDYAYGLPNIATRSIDMANSINKIRDLLDNCDEEVDRKLHELELKCSLIPITYNTYRLEDAYKSIRANENFEKFESTSYYDTAKELILWNASKIVDDLEKAKIFDLDKQNDIVKKFVNHTINKHLNILDDDNLRFRTLIYEVDKDFLPYLNRADIYLYGLYAELTHNEYKHKFFENTCDLDKLYSKLQAAVAVEQMRDFLTNCKELTNEEKELLKAENITSFPIKSSTVKKTNDISER